MITITKSIHNIHNNYRSFKTGYARFEIIEKPWILWIFKKIDSTAPLGAYFFDKK